MKRFLLDTNIVSAVIKDRGRRQVSERIAAVGPDRVCTSVIVAAEIRFGIAKRSSIRLRDAADAFLRSIEVLALEPPVDLHHAMVRTDLEQRGVVIGANDLLIAAHCLAIDATLVTHNTREFARVRDLRIEDWLTS